MGLGMGRYESHFTPVYVNIPGLNGEKLSSVSCGNTTTFVCTEISKRPDSSDDVSRLSLLFSLGIIYCIANILLYGQVTQRERPISGGRVFMAGTTNVLGRQCDAFTLLTGFVYSTSSGSAAVQVKELVPIKQVSAGVLGYLLRYFSHPTANY